MRPTVSLRVCRSCLLNGTPTRRIWLKNLTASPTQVRRQGTVDGPHKNQLHTQETGKSFGDPTVNKPVFEELALLAPAIVPEDPLGVVRSSDSAAALLDHSALIVERQIEMLNVFLVLELNSTLIAGIRAMKSICYNRPPGQPCRVHFHLNLV